MHESGRRNGVFTVRRGIEPFIGGLALPGGFQIYNPFFTPKVKEPWEYGACREAYEEINVVCKPHHVKHVLTESSYRTLPNGEEDVGAQNLIIGSVMGAFLINEFTPDKEAAERVVLFPDDEEQLCFSIHRKALAMHWDSLDVEHNVDMTDVK